MIPGSLRRLTALRRAPFQGLLSPLAIMDFRLLLSSSFIWWAARFMEFVLVGWLVLELTNSPWQVAVMGFYRSIPFLFVGFVSGPIIDNLGRRKVILLAQLTNVVITVLLALLLWVNRLELWHLAVGSLLMGTAWSLDWPARRSFVPDLVGRGKTVDALLLENFSQNIARITGPFFGGVLFDVLGAPGAFTGLAILSGLTLLILLGLSNQPVPRKTKAAQSSPLGNIVDGLRYVRHSQPILGSLLITVVMNFLVFPYVAMLPIFARDVLGQEATGLGGLGAAAGIGAFAGLFIINRIRNFVSPGWIFAVGSAFQAIMVLLFAFSAHYGLSTSLLFFSGIGQVCFGIMQSSIILLAASDEMRSRAMGTLVLAIGAGPVGQLQIGALAEEFGAPLAVQLHATVAVLAIIVVMAALPGMRQRIEESDNEPAPASAD